jgi:RNA polymerase sigma-70 factor (ECF subfamily)
MSCVAVLRLGRAASQSRAARTGPVTLARDKEEVQPQVSVATSLPTISQNPDIAALAQQAADGDRQAFAQLVMLVQRPLYYAVMRITRHPEDARDIVQRSFLKAWSNLARLENPARFRSWLFAIGLNLARNHIRDQAKRPSDPLEGAKLAALGADPIEEIDAQKQRAALRSALERLPDKQRQCVSLRIDAELNFREIGEVVGCSEGSARVNFHYGLQRLRMVLRGDGHE